MGPDGKVVKKVVRSSFGKIVYDYLPCLYVPIGFCAGLEDRTPTSYGLTGATMIRALADLCRLTLQTTRAAMVTSTTIRG